MTPQLAATTRARAPTPQLTPDPDAQVLAEHMVTATEVHRAILEETVESADSGSLTESGRTACGSLEDVRAPVARYPQAVELASCPPVDAAGIWHTHVTAEQFRNPENSLPDWANVVFEDVDVHAVVGTQSMEVIVAAADRPAMRQAFQDALGADVASQRGVIRALRAGDIADRPATRQRVRDALRPLVSRSPVAAAGLDARADVIPPAPQLASSTVATAPGMVACCSAHQGLSPDVGGLRNLARESSDGLMMISRAVANRSIDEALGIVAGQFIASWLLGR